MTGKNRAKPPGYGEPAPLFGGDLDDGTSCNISKGGGQWVILQFLMRMSSDLVRDAHQVILDRSALFDDVNASYFGVIVNASDLAEGVRTSLPGRRYFKDIDERITRIFGLKIEGGYMPMTILLDPTLRVVAAEPLRKTAEVLDLMERYIKAEPPTRTDTTAPVLTVPRIFEPEFCKTLIEYYNEKGGASSGFMRQVGDKTVVMHDPSMKRRKDVTIADDDPLREAVLTRIRRRLLPAIERAFSWRGTRIERYLIACYDSDEQGFFTPHRDNTTAATVHRKFAVSINLNADDYDGGALRFPEFGPRTYKPPTGGATVFGCGLLHEATPVTRGVRYAFLPFLYDEEAAKIRAKNAHALVLESPASSKIGEEAATS